jgi:DNA-binding NtrC family response regulator
MTFAPHAGSPPRVLVSQGLEVPEPWVRRLADSLRPVAVEFVPVRSPDRAIQRFSQVRPRVIVLDEPSLTDVGWSLLRQARRIDASVACLMVVRRAEPALLNKALQLFAYSVFEVPVDVKMMGQMVNRLLQRAMYRSQ